MNQSLAPTFLICVAVLGGTIHAQPVGRIATGKISFKNLSVPRSEIKSGQRKDGIPAIINPKVVSGRHADFMTPQTRVLGTTIRGESRAWPVPILNLHEIVNDKLGGTAVAVTYCPLCDSAIIFDRGQREFGVSGFLYNSNVLMYDRNTFDQSLWSQLMARAISGPAAGEALQPLPVELTTWADWLTRHPDTTVMSPQTGHRVDYSKDPYAGYFRNSRLMFPVNRVDRRLKLKQPVLGLSNGQDAVAVPTAIKGAANQKYEITVGEAKAQVFVDANSQTVHVIKADPEISWAYSFWFAWSAFYPDTSVVGTNDLHALAMDEPSRQQVLP